MAQGSSKEKSTIVRLDEYVTGLIQQLELGVFETLVVPGGALFGWGGTVGVVFPLLYYFHGKKGLYFFMCSAAVAQVVSRFAKQLIRRQRPTVPNPTPRRVWKRVYQHLLDVVHDPNCKDGASFPSGDTMSGGATAGVLMIITKSWWPLFIPFWVGFGRQYFFCHWFLDVLFGGLNGLLSSYFVDRILFGKELGGYKAIRDKHILFMIPTFLALMKSSTYVTDKVREAFLKEREDKE